MNQIKVGLVVGDQEWLANITNIIHQCPDLQILWTSGAPKEALQLVNSTPVNIIIIDMNLTKGQHDSIELVQKITANIKVKVKVIMISGLHHESLIAQAFLSGAVNYVFKENVDELPEIVRGAFKRNPAYEVLIKYYQKTYQELLLSRLTPSERDIHLLIKQGRSVGQIALVTHKAEGTVKNQASRAKRKLQNAHQFLD